MSNTERATVASRFSYYKEPVAKFFIYWDKITNKAYMTFQGKLIPLGIVFPKDIEASWRLFEELMTQFPSELFMKLYFPEHLTREWIDRNVEFNIPQIQYPKKELTKNYLMIIYLSGYMMQVIEFDKIPYVKHVDKDYESFVQVKSGFIAKVFDTQEDLQEFQDYWYSIKG